MGKVICAWCKEQDRVETIIGVIDTEQDSHGICDQHQASMLAQITQLKSRWPKERLGENPRKRRRRK